ncbi:Hypothetical predicted protein [Paramuricea clavata]|uniref:Uncharacterized protein n=1 Tax=Paramuricea clavata TaxID=317549 RepID=A0A6S7L699_PARCT|nr:Hypothetical predicted protein [Paramuricea clavata]
MGAIYVVCFVFCDAEHFSASCEKIKDPQARKNILKRQGHCFLCLRKGHRINQCTSNRRCRKCSGKHHQSICEFNSSQPPQDPSSLPPENKPGQDSTTGAVVNESSNSCESIGIVDYTESDHQRKEFLKDIAFDKTEGKYQVDLPWKKEQSLQNSNFGLCVSRLHHLNSRLSKEGLLNQYDDIFKEQERTVFGLTSSPAILNGTIQHHLSLYASSEPEVSKLLTSSLYADDFPGGATPEEAAFGVYEKAKRMDYSATGEILNIKPIEEHHNFLFKNLFDNVTKDPNHKLYDLLPQKHNWHHDLRNGHKFDIPHFNTNCTKNSFIFANVNQETSEHKSSEGELSKINLLGDTSPELIAAEKLQEKSSEVKILGLNWNIEKVCFSFDVQLIEYLKSLPPTKKSMLKASVKIFDPIGQISPITVNLKMWFQVLCSSKIEWDEALEKKWLKRWTSLVGEVSALSEINVPRSYFQNNSEESLAFKFDVYYWVDSFITLCWIKNNKRLRQYVQNRVNEIRRLSAKEKWRFCSGEFNPADIPSRGCAVKEL